MRVDLINITKSFGPLVVFRKLDFSFEQGKHYAILGSNGSGKSTLLKLVSGMTNPTVGEVHYNGQKPDASDFSFTQNIAFSAPYAQLLERFTVKECVDFYLKHKSAEYTAAGIVHTANLEAFANTQIRHLSSGMRQRLKLTLALLSNASLVLLDEPTSNLDEKNIGWYRNLLLQHTTGKTVIIGTNHPGIEFPLQGQSVRIEDFKPGKSLV